jgi:predicted KAP-like P-loop ATPase
MIDATTPGGEFTTDAPIEDFDADQLGRGPFARGIARTIAAQQTPASLVVGIYGAWGDGKTSVLHLVEKSFGRDEKVIPVRFNPWQLGDEQAVFRGFFATLAAAIDTRLTSGVERVGAVLKRYGQVLAPVPLAGGALSALVGTAGQQMSEDAANLDGMKARIEKALGDAGRRVVIFIDDLDRLDKSEIEVIFRLVKVAADFDHTAYVLAFDDLVISAALADRYATGSIHGTNFLEKIVQLPLHLPPVPRAVLRRIALSSVDKALAQAGVNLSDPEAQRFVPAFDRAVEAHLTTLRTAKRYGNAVLFALPMIADETNVVDLLLIEAMRIFYPRLYEWVRGNRGPVLHGPGDGDQGKDVIRGGFDLAVKSLSPAGRDEAKALLNELFPRTESVWQNKSWSDDWVGMWTKERRITSPEYFDRYFAYTVPIGDVRDSDVDRLVALLTAEGQAGPAVELLRELVRDGFDRLVPKLGVRLEEADSDLATAAVMALADIGDDVPDRARMMGLSDMSTIALLAARALRQVEPSGRWESAKALVIAAQPLRYALELFRWIQTTLESKSDDESAGNQSSENDASAGKAIPAAPAEPAESAEFQQVGKALSDRIEQYWLADPPIDALGDKTGTSFYFWGKYGDPEAQRAYLKARILAEPSVAAPLILTFLVTTWSLETGASFAGSVSRERYDELVDYVDAMTMIDALTLQFGDELAADPSDAATVELTAARQFVSLHKRVVADFGGEPTDGTPDPET